MDQEGIAKLGFLAGLKLYGRPCDDDPEVNAVAKRYGINLDQFPTKWGSGLIWSETVEFKKQTLIEFMKQELENVGMDDWKENWSLLSLYDVFGWDENGKAYDVPDLRKVKVQTLYFWFDCVITEITDITLENLKKCKKLCKEFAAKEQK